MRIACYGWVDADGTSMSAASYLLLRELTEGGISVDLFGTPGHIPPPTGLRAERFEYLGASPPLPVRTINSLPERMSRGINRICRPVPDAAWRRTYEPVARSRHAKAPYAALLALGTPSPFRVPGVPTVTWAQGGLSTELDAITRLRRQIVETSGWPFYLALSAAYRLGNGFERRALASSDRIIVGSEWSRRTFLEGGFDPACVDAVPHATDLHLFRPGERELEAGGGDPTILSLGRLDPRKRLDLLLDAFRLVLLECPEATLRVIGSPGYAPGQLSLLERFPARDRVEYQSGVSRRHVPNLLRKCAVLVQTSENENFGSSIAEALACGTPVVAGPSNGTSEYVDRNSQIFAEYRPESVAGAVLTVIRAHQRNPGEVSRAARAAAERWFSPPIVANRVIELIEAAVEARRHQDSAT